MPSLDIVERRLVWLSVHGQHDALPTGDHRRGAMEVDAGLHGRPVLPTLPGDGQADGVDAEVAVGREQAVGPRPPLGGVVVEAHEQLPGDGLGRPSGGMRDEHARARKYTAPTTAALPKDAGLSHPRARESSENRSVV